MGRSPAPGKPARWNREGQSRYLRSEFGRAALCRPWTASLLPPNRASCWNWSSGRLSDRLRVLPLGFTCTDCASAAACGFWLAFIWARLISSLTISPRALAFCGVSVCAWPVKTTLLPNFTPPLADCTVCTTGGICPVLGLFAVGVKEAGGTVHNAHASWLVLN